MRRDAEPPNTDCRRASTARRYLTSSLCFIRYGHYPGVCPFLPVREQSITIKHFSRGSTTTGDAVYFNIELIDLAESMSSSALDQLGQFLTRVEHAGLHRGGGNAEYLRALIDRFS